MGQRSVANITPPTGFLRQSMEAIHIDAPQHFSMTGKTVDTIPLGRSR